VAFHYRNQIHLGQEKALLKRPVRHNKAVYKSQNIETMGQLGEGNFGKVYKVLIKSENRLCAMKTTNAQINRESREMFMRYHESCGA